MSEEPPAKKIKVTGWEDHKLNISEAIMKADEGRHLSDIANDSIATLQGIGPLAEKLLGAMGLETIRDLATYKYYLLARALVSMSETETKDGRPAESIMNVDKAVDKAWEGKSFSEMIEAPISAIEGLTSAADDLLKELGVKTIQDLANLKYCRWAEAIVLLGDSYEENKTAGERKTEAALKKLQN